VSNPFSSALHRAIEDSARARGVLVFAGSCEEDATRERELIGSFRDRRVDGIIVVPASHDHTYLYEEQRAGTALVFVDRPAGHLDADSVVSDNRGGALAAVEHLLERGHRRIALIGFDDIPLADLVDPPISVVAQDPQAIGRAAAELLFRRLDGDASPTVHLVMPVQLIARGSGELPL